MAQKQDSRFYAGASLIHLGFGSYEVENGELEIEGKAIVFGRGVYWLGIQFPNGFDLRGKLFLSYGSNEFSSGSEKLKESNLVLSPGVSLGYGWELGESDEMLICLEVDYRNEEDHDSNEATFWSLGPSIVYRSFISSAISIDLIGNISFLAGEVESGSSTGSVDSDGYDVSLKLGISFWI